MKLPAEGDAPEGATPLDPDEREGLKYRHITTRAELDEIEQANITDALQWMPRRRSFDILTEKSIRQLHQRLFGEVWRWAGSFRQTEKNIGVDPAKISVELCNLLADARYWAEYDTWPVLEAGARFHHRLVQIHLFPNGNGRHARIAADLYLDEYFNASPINWDGDGNLMASGERRRQYIAALRAADKGDVAPMLMFVQQSTI